MVWYFPNSGHSVQQCTYLLTHQKIRVGENIEQVDGFKQSGTMTKQRRIILGKSYMLSYVQFIYGTQLGQKTILFHYDNSTVKSIWNKGSTHCREIMTLVLMLHFCAAHYNMHVMITHITGTDNCIANAISRFQMDCFRSQAPYANPHVDTILALPTPSSTNYENVAST